MPYLETAQQWLTQSTLLLQARPSTTRITTKYTIKALPDPSKPSKSKPRKPKPTSNTTPSDPAQPPAQAPEPIRAVLTLKTYDPVSGATLKYSTTKAAEVSRLVQILGRLARPMAGLPEVKEEALAAGEGGEGEATGAGTPVAESAKPVQAGAGGGGGGKKKKGKGKK